MWEKKKIPEEETMKINKWCAPCQLCVSWCVLAFKLSHSILPPLASRMRLSNEFLSIIVSYISFMDVSLQRPNGLMHSKMGTSRQAAACHSRTSSFAINIYCHRFNFTFYFLLSIFFLLSLYLFWSSSDLFVAEKSYVSGSRLWKIILNIAIRDGTHKICARKLHIKWVDVHDCSVT